MEKVKEYAVCEFTVIGSGLETIYNNKEILWLDDSTIIEFAAVKIRNTICNSEIVEQFHSFSQIEGVDPEDIDFETHRAFRGVTPNMLICAPTLDKALNDFYRFTKGCTLLLRDEWPQEPLKTLKKCGKRYGLRFGNPVIRITNIVNAAEAMENYNKIGRLDILKIASGMRHQCPWKKLFAEYEVPFGRDDCLGYAHAFAELIVKLSDKLDMPF